MKNKLNVWRIFLAVMVIGVLLVGCGNPAGGDPDLPVKTIEWVKDNDGFYQFYTNDPKNYGYGFLTLSDNPKENPDIYEIECQKISGAHNYPYGMIFGVSDTSVNVFYCVNIDTNGYYTIRERVPDGAGGYKWADNIKDWTFSARLKTGYNTLNTIKVEKLSGYYFIHFNDNAVDMFPYTVADENKKGHGSRVGFYTSIGSATDEKFPNTPVDTRFRAK